MSSDPVQAYLVPMGSRVMQVDAEVIQDKRDEMLLRHIHVNLLAQTMVSLRADSLERWNRIRYHDKTIIF